VIAVNGFYCHGPVALQLGRLALLAGRLDAADAHLDHALARAEALRSPVWRAHVLHARSRLYRRLGRRADRSRADRCAAESREIARSAGLVRLLRDLEGPGTA